jgi:predicted RecB family nuclease
VHNLSKSKLLAFRQCPKRLWLEINKPELRDDSGSQTAFAAGHQVGEAAQAILDRQGDGINVDPHLIGWDASAEQTQVALRTGDRTVFEALLQIPGAMALADVMRPDPNFSELRWEMIEVKASTSVKDYHRDDVAIQTYIADESGVPLSKSMLAHIDTNFVYAGDGDYSGLLHLEDLTEEARARHEEVGTWIEEAQAIAAMATEPVVKTGKQCTNPFACAFCSYCGTGRTAEADPLAVLPHLHWKKREQFKLSGIERLADVPTDQLTEIQQRVQSVHLNGQPYCDRASATKLFSQDPLPAYFLDFETVSFAVPIWEGTRPYQAIPFQYSLHKLDADGELGHEKFLDLSGVDPRRAMAEKLIQDCGDSGAIYVFSASVEAGIIEKLEEQFLDLFFPLESIRQRIVDLLPIVKRCYYHPDQQGSWSLKAIIEPMTGMSYSNLEGVKVGPEAGAAFIECLDEEICSKRKELLHQQMLDYCELDTLATVRIWEFLKIES